MFQLIALRLRPGLLEHDPRQLTGPLFGGTSIGDVVGRFDSAVAHGPPLDGNQDSPTARIGPRRALTFAEVRIA